jgi:AraC family transcriptional regulator, transcriptional activator of pobA
MRQKKSAIPVHFMQKENKLGLEIRRFAGIGSAGIYQKTAHRDDHYLFFLQEKGTSSIMVDFTRLPLTAGDILCVFPGQIHYGITANNSYAWAIALDTALISDMYKTVFEELILQNKPVSVPGARLDILLNSIRLLDELNTIGPPDEIKDISLPDELNNIRPPDEYNKAESHKDAGRLYFSKQIIRGAIDACIGIFASVCREQEEYPGQSAPRPVQITQAFKRALLRSYKTIKSPSAYAAALNISPSYLNEAVNQVSGFPVSYWIHQQIITEAKRILFYTDDAIKEIAYSLGYEDPTYFSRLFNKVEGISPLHFRENSRK